MGGSGCRLGVAPCGARLRANPRLWRQVFYGKIMILDLPPCEGWATKQDKEPRGILEKLMYQMYTAIGIMHDPIAIP